MNYPTISGSPYRFLLIIMTILFTMSLIGSSTADPSYSPNQGKMPLKVQFSLPGGDKCDSVTWDFGDGGTSKEGNPSYSYSRMGFFYPQCICTLPGATITYTFDKIVASNADMFDDDTHDQHYPYHTDVAVSADGLSREDLIKQGTGLYMLGQYQHAADTYKKLVEMTDSDPVILAEYGTILVRLSRWNEAQNAFNQSINVRPDADILNAYGRVLLEMNRFDDALFAYNQSLKMNDASASAWAGRAEVLKNLDNPDDAVVAYEKSISLDEKEAAVWKGYGEVLTTLGKDDDAVKAYQKAIDLGMKGADIYLKLGGALRKTGQDGDAQRAMDSARSYQGALYSSSSNSILRCTAGGAM